MLAEVSFGEWLKRRRKSVGLTQEQLAQQINCSTITLRKIEAEERRPSEQIVGRLAEIFSIPPTEQRVFLRFARGDWKTAPTESSTDAPWHTSTPSPRSNLPASLTSLIGREQELANLSEYLSNPSIRLVTLIGPPGIGKTRLSIESARASLNDFGDGVFVVGLAPLDDPALITPTVIQTLGYVGTKQQSVLDQLTEGIGDKRMLLVLDNCEHLIDEVAALASRLLSACLRLKILATSRESLRISGEWLYAVPTLDVPKENSSVDIETASNFPALSLFAERARAVRSDFTLNAENVHSVASICTQLDGLPLAIELIAARVRLMSPHAVLTRMNDQFILSANGMRALSTRQKTLNHAIGWSYNLLSQEEQRVFSCLSVFSGGFTLEAAESIFSHAPMKRSVPDVIASLLDKSLLQRTVNNEPPGDSRFSMLVTIQKFALDRLQSMGKETEVSDRHFGYFLKLAELGEPHMSGHGQLEWLARLQAETENFRAAFEWNLAWSRDIEKSLRLANALFSFWRIRSDFHEAQHWLDIVLNLPQAKHYPNAYAKAMLSMGIIQLMYISAEVAEPILSQSVMLARTLQDNHILAEALDFLGLALGFQKKFDQAHILLEESKSLSHASNNKKGIALTNWHLGWVVEDEGDLTAALEFQKQALAILEELGNIHQQSILLRAIGEKLSDRGELKQGSIMLRQALSTAYKVGSKLETGNAFMALSFAEEQQVNLRKAVQFLQTAQKLYLICGAQSNLRSVEKELGRLRTQVDSSIFEAAIAEAQAWTMEQAIAYALQSASFG